MKRSKFSPTQITKILKEFELGKTAENCPELIHKSIYKKCAYYELCYVEE